MRTMCCTFLLTNPLLVPPPVVPSWMFYFCPRYIGPGYLRPIKNTGTKCWGRVDTGSSPINMGQRIYELHGLKELRWYEVKISYPATIPASFSIAIVKDNSTKVFNLGRRLLNTEKLIFKAENILTEISGHGSICAFVSVQPAGVVAKSHLKEQEFVIFNIVCDELIYGIPTHAWWVGFLVIFVIIISFCIPTLLPSELLPRKSNVEPMKRVS